MKVGIPKLFVYVLLFALIGSLSVQAACGQLSLSSMSCWNTPGAPAACTCTGTSYCSYNLYNGQSGANFVNIKNNLWASDLIIKVNGQYANKTIPKLATDYITLQFVVPSTGSGTSTQTSWQIEADDSQNPSNCWTATVNAYSSYGPSPEQQAAAAQQAAQQAAANALNAISTTINKLSSDSSSVQVKVTEAGSTCSAAQANWASANSLLNDAKNRYSSGQSKYTAGDYSGAQSEATIAQSSATQAKSQFEAATSAADSCKQEQQQRAAQEAAAAAVQEAALQSAQDAVNRAQAALDRLDSFISNVATPLGISSNDGASLKTSARDYLTLAESSVSSGDASTAQSNAVLSENKASASLSVYQDLSRKTITARANEVKSKLSGTEQKIAQYSISQSTQPQALAIEQSLNLLSSGQYDQSLSALKTAEENTKTLEATVNSMTKQIDNAKSQEQTYLIGGGIVVVLAVGITIYYVRKHRPMKSSRKERKN